MNNPKGVTLVELIIILLLVGIMAVVAISRTPSVQDFRKEAALNRVKADLRYVKEFAISNSCRTRAAFDTDTDSYTAFTNLSGSWDSMTNPETNTPPFTVQLNQGIYSGVEIIGVSFNLQNTVEFDSIGRPHSYDGASSTLLQSDGTVTLTGDDIVTVTKDTGRIN